MHKILFYYSQLNIGGAEKSLIRLMNAFASKGNEVTYLGRYSGGAGEYLLSDKVDRHWLSGVLNKSNRFSYFLSQVKCFVERLYSTYKIRRWPVFDVVYIGLQGLSPEFVIDNLKARQICIFIRTDISSIPKKKAVIANFKTHFDRIDSFICVAETVRKSLIDAIPEAEEKAQVVYNILAADDMRKRLTCAPNPFKNETESTFRIVSICRISDVSKGVFRMVRIGRQLIKEGFKFRWYIVGDGEDLAALRQKITDAGLDGIMITPGRVDNPFGYYRECDLVAMLSYYEGLCGVVNEAKISRKAIIATRVSGIDEQLTHGVNGWIVENDEDRILEGMRRLLTDNNIIRSLTNDIYPEALTDDNSKIDKLLKLAE